MKNLKNLSIKNLRLKSAVVFFFLFFLHGFSIGNGQQGISYNVLRLCAGGALKHGRFNPPLNLIKEQMMNIADNPHLHKANVSTSYYLVRYCGGSYDDYYSAVIFVTNKKLTATKYVTKFNRILKKWKKHYEQFETDKFGMKWIADEHVEKHFDRWNSLQNITKCYYEEVSFR